MTLRSVLDEKIKKIANISSNLTTIDYTVNEQDKK